MVIETCWGVGGRASRVTFLERSIVAVGVRSRKKSSQRGRRGVLLTTTNPPKHVHTFTSENEISRSQRGFSSTATDAPDAPDAPGCCCSTWVLVSVTCWRILMTLSHISNARRAHISLRAVYSSFTRQLDEVHYISSNSACHFIITAGRGC